MASVNNEKLYSVASILYMETYEASFRGKSRGKFKLSREQMKNILNVSKLHEITICRLQEEALKMGLVIIDIDDAFACIELHVVRGFRSVPANLIREQFEIGKNEETNGDVETGDEDEDWV